MKKTTKALIVEKLLKLEPGIPTPYREFKQLGSSSSVHRAIYDLCETGNLVRVMRGFYAKPKLIPALPGKTISCSPEGLAHAWAIERGYVLVTSGFEEAYKLRFQTQAPVKAQLWSNGPNKIISIGHAHLTIKHVKKSKLLWSDAPLGRLYRALLTQHPNHLHTKSLQQAFLLLYEHDSDVQIAVAELKKSAETKIWRPLLEEAFPFKQVEGSAS